MFIHSANTKSGYSWSRLLGVDCAQTGRATGVYRGDCDCHWCACVHTCLTTYLHLTRDCAREGEIDVSTSRSTGEWYRPVLGDGKFPSAPIAFPPVGSSPSQLRRHSDVRSAKLMHAERAREIWSPIKFERQALGPGLPDSVTSRVSTSRPDSGMISDI